MKDAKYLIAYIVPAVAFWGFHVGGWASYAALIITFGLLPFFELFLPFSNSNFSEEEEVQRNETKYFDLILYLHVPIIYALLGFYFTRIAAGGLAPYELIGMTLSMGVIAGGFGINVGHELGHRHTMHEKLFAKLLLLPSLYTHFTIEHNLGHHKHVATDKDPSSARLNENLYAFWIRSVSGVYTEAWNLEKRNLARAGKNFWSLQNEMIQNSILQIAYLVTLGFLFGWMILPFAFAVAINGFLQLETVNYIEHYGLRRKKLANGRYEPVLPKHSWNSNHELGRIFLYELTRHSDHHYKATRKYQVLRHFDDSPQLPLGYPGSMILSLFPPMWFRVMNKQLEEQKVEMVAA